MRKTDEMIEAEKALRQVQKIVVDQLEYHNAQIGKTPLGGWSQERHDKYHRDHALECAEVRIWIFNRLMRGNPD